jgi:hypothetical protein
MNDATLAVRLQIITCLGDTGSDTPKRVSGIDARDYFSAQTATPVVQKNPSLMV